MYAHQMENRRDVVVVIADEGEAASKALLCEGGRIAQLLGGNLYALSGNVAPQAVTDGLRHIPFRLMLFGHTDQGRELAPVVARNFGASAVTDCFDIRLRGSTLFYARYVYGEQFEQEVCFERPPEFVSLNLDLIEGTEDSLRPSGVKEIKLEGEKGENGKRVLYRVPPDFKTVDIRHATRIVDIGAGCDQADLIALAEKLADLLKASIGGTRVVVDSGRIPKNRMIGQTGKTVSPELCLTLGVSGSAHHVAGFKRCSTIISVNSDVQAPVFAACDEGFVADLKGLLPKLIHRIQQYRARGWS
ncbi:MAG: electron transfer flavoprotein subunit alpha/FixB family protein [candidate division WOR-3 bacterium]